MAEPFAVTIDDSEVRAALQRALAATGNLRPAMKAIGERLLRSTEKNFYRECSPDGIPWVQSLAAKEERRKTLTKSHQLRNSFFYKAASDNVRVGTPKDYAAIHQLGFDGSVAVPAHIRRIREAFGKKLKFPVYVNVKPYSRKLTMIPRPFLGVSPSDKVEILDLLAEHIEQALAEQ